MRALVPTLALAAVVAATAPSAAALPSPAIEAQVVPIQRPTAIVAYRRACPPKATPHR